MKKLFTILAAMLFAGSMMAEGLLFEQTYPGNPSEFTNNYTSSFTLTTDGYTLTYKCFNNGKEDQKWDAIRAGRKNDASTAMIETAAIAEKVSKVIVDFTQIDAAKTKALYLEIADNKDFAGAASIDATIAIGEVAFVVETPDVNKFYRIVLDMESQGSSNGFNRIDKVQFISPDGGTPILPPSYDTLTVAQAIEVAKALADGATTENKYYVEGYVVYAAQYNPNYGNQIFFMVDDVNKPDSVFEAYAAYPSKDDQVYPVIDGDKVRAFGKMKKYVGDITQLELVNPTVEFIEEAQGERVIPGIIGPDTISVAEAVAIAQALPEPAEAGKSTTDTKEYVVAGYAVTVYDQNDDKSWSFFMADEAGAYGEFMASSTTADSDVKENDFMLVRGKIAKRKTNAGKIQLQIYKGSAIHGKAPEGIENIVLTEKAQKVMVDGVMYIVRDNKMFDVRGTQVR